ncbi:MAG: hypothetical protein AAGA42_02105 [Actinomycetota bacterium]
MSAAATTTRVETGDVLEFAVGDDAMTVLVLLATDEALVLDPLNGETPFVIRLDEIAEFRKFDADDLVDALTD